MQLKRNKRNTFQLIIGGKIKTPHKIFTNIIKVIYCLFIYLFFHIVYNETNYNEE